MHYYSIDGHESQHKINLAGFPQGSSPGPILFLFYINDLSSALERSETNLFADDTNFSLVQFTLFVIIKKSTKHTYKYTFTRILIY